ncbi:MAG: cytochrome c oxidase subunit II [Alphaproteobacteria bacterium]|jgi:cytochrome c oxidase subunit 2
MRLIRKFASVMFVATLAVFGVGAPAIAAGPQPWQMGFQPAASPVMERITDFHNFLLVLILAIAIFVLALMLYVMVRFNAKANPTPSRTTHHTLLEVVWTVVPIIILVLMTIPSFKLLYYMDRTDKPEMTLKVTGSQWFWTYEYPDQGKFIFDSQMVPDAEIKPGQLRLLEVDNRIVLPVNTNIRVLVTANSVLHAWAVPALGVKIDAVPGRMNETWVRITKPGVYYGQCSELCGINHGFMPIAINAVSKADFAKWTATAKVKFKAEAEPATKTTNIKLARTAPVAAGSN